MKAEYRKLSKMEAIYAMRTVKMRENKQKKSNSENAFENRTEDEEEEGGYKITYLGIKRLNDPAHLC
jgi:hypothetical protein